MEKIITKKFQYGERRNIKHERVVRCEFSQKLVEFLNVESYMKYFSSFVIVNVNKTNKLQILFY